MNHTGIILSTAFNSSASILYSGSIEGFVNVKGATKGVISCAVSLDGSLLATGHQDGRVTIRDSEGKVVSSVKAHTFMAYSLAISASGNLISGGFDGEIHSWDFTSGRKIRTFKHGGLVFSVQRPMASPFLLTSGSSKFCLWDEESGELVKETSTLAHGTHLFATYMPGLDQIATAGDDNVTRLWSLDSQSIEAEVVIGEDQASAIWALDNRRILLATAYGSVFLVNFAEERVEAHYGANEDWIRRVVSPASGKLAFTSCQDGTASEIDLGSGEVTPILDEYRPISSLTLHEDSLVFVDANDETNYGFRRMTAGP